MLSCPLTPLLLLTLVISTALYGYGFLLADLSKGSKNEGGKEPHPGCPLPLSSAPHRTVLMVIDAWKWAFLAENEEMEYMRKSIDAGSATVLRAHVQTPTVTMPRIKALTSGSVPSFASVLLNFHSTAAREDSWPRRVKESGRSLVFYGDDTWLSLFPDVFDQRSEGVVSFYVTDYTQVDDNVTRHLTSEFSRSKDETASVLVLHYLGLDHVGHSLGGESTKIGEKLREMDEIVRRIREMLIQSDDSFLFTILGDHGMTKAGNHGGSSPDETLVPVVVYRSGGEGERREEGRTNITVPSSIQQLDVASFLSHRLAVEVPEEGIGMDFSHQIGFDASQSIIGLARDVRRLSEKIPSGERKDLLISCVHDLSSLLGANCRLKDEKKWRETVERCYEETRRAQSDLISSASQFDNRSMLIATVFTIMTVIYLLHSLIFTSMSMTNLSPSTFLSLPIHFLSFFASSLVEEEHDVWYFLLASSLLIEVFRAQKKTGGGQSVIRPLAALFLHRLAISFTMGKRRRWNIGEDHFPAAIVADFIDSKALSLSIGEVLSSVSRFVTVIVIALFFLIPDRSKRSFHFLSFLPLILRSVGYSTPEWTSCVVRATLVGGVVLRAAEKAAERKWLPSGFPSSISLIFPLLLSISRPEFVPVLLLSYLLGKQLAKCRDPEGLTATALSAAFFYSGGGNSLATVDIAVGYTGLSEYQEWIVGAQIALNAYAPCLLVLGGYLSEISTSDPVNSLCIEWILRRAVSLLGCQLSLFIFRYHLFVWSVFAPRFLFETTHLAVTVVITTLVWCTSNYRLL